jgi:hypothetical protein
MSLHGQLACAQAQVATNMQHNSVCNKLNVLNIVPQYKTGCDDSLVNKYRKEEGLIK